MLHTEVIRVQHIGAVADGYQKAQKLQLSGTSYMCLYEAENSEPNLSEIIGGINKKRGEICVWRLYEPDITTLDGFRIKSDCRPKPL